MKTKQFLLVLVVLSIGFHTDAFADLRVKSKYTIGDQSSENTVYTKGQRQRVEPGPGVAIVTQHDIKRTIQVVDQNKTYIVMPAAAKLVQPAANPPRPGGVVQYSVTVTDTGETQMMFGYTARRVRTQTVKEPGAGACDAAPQTLEVDGWYIDYEPEVQYVPAVPATAEDSCRDEARHVHLGNGKLGYPVGYTMKITKGGETTFMTMTVVDFSTDSLDASLFEIPSGYTETSMDSATASMAAATPAPKPDGATRVCVGEPENRAGQPLGGASATQEFIAGLIQAKVDAVALGGFTATDLTAIDIGVARDKQCDYILSSQITEIKKASGGGGLGKFGGMLSKASSIAGGGPAKDKVEARVDAKLASLTGLKPVSFTASGSNGGGFGLTSAFSLASTAVGYGLFMKMFNPSMMSAFSGMGDMGPAGLGMGGVPGMPRGGLDPGLGYMLTVLQTTKSMMAPAAPTEEGIAVSDALKEAAKKVGDAIRKKK